MFVLIKLYTNFMKNQGFGYIEALLVIIIVGIALTPMVNLFLTTFRLNRAGYQYLQASLCSQTILSILRSKIKTLNIEYSKVKLNASDIGYVFPKEFLNFKPEVEIVLSPYQNNTIHSNIKIIWYEKKKKREFTIDYLFSTISGRNLKMGEL